MGDVVVTEFMTLDGVIEDPGGAEGSEHAGWELEFNRGDEGNAFKNDELMAADAQLLGRLTYEGFAKAWPPLRGEFGEYSEKMNAMPKYVVSTTLSDEDASWENSTVIRDDVAGAVRRLKEEVQGDILVQGSATLARSLAEEGLVDRYRLMVFPVVLGTGKRLFTEGLPKTSLDVLELRQIGPDGAFTLVCRPKARR
jgi:dihydrofolate reductase